MVTASLPISTIEFGACVLGAWYDFDRRALWSSWVTWTVIAVVVGVVVCFLAVFVLAALFEKQRVKICEPVQPDQSIELPDYLRIMANNARFAGFIDKGLYRHTNWSHYKILMSILISPDGKSVALISAGTTLRMRTRRTLLISIFDNNAYHMTTDEAANTDLSGLVTTALVLNADFAELWTFHQVRLSESSHAVCDLSSEPAADVVERFLRSVAERNVELGFGKFVDKGQGIWRYTLSGTVRLMRENFGGQLQHAVAQKERAKIPRPGDRKYLEGSESNA